MKVTEACRAREVPTAGFDTPLLVPSFSSRGFPNLAVLYDFLSSEVPEASLISAYDLHHRSLPLESVNGSDTVFVDSGGYEAKLTYDPDEAYVDDRRGNVWSLAQYRSVLDGLEPFSQVVMVSFDHAGTLPLAEQVASARSLFAGYPRYASDFLAKPETTDAPFVNAASIAADIGTIAGSFCILGVTEKELGGSMLERCRNLLRIRGALREAGSETPIHVFGCLEPLSILSYFFCGADVFDGLSWLRFAFSYPEGRVSHGPTDTMTRGEWRYPDGELRAARWVRNLGVLRDLGGAMEDYCENRSVEGLTAWEGLGEVLALVSAAGLNLEEGGFDGW
ncbi:MAG: hypothetical protein M3Q60_02590 [Actinomycetota bacterium]|nr:hypothetical protein [Actinomycetota bacterium]